MICLRSLLSSLKYQLSIVCEFFKVGQCTKGFKCKFSHDLNVQRKGEKIDIYSDKRDDETMEDWDQETLEKVVESKKNEYNQNKPTDIVCTIRFVGTITVTFICSLIDISQFSFLWFCSCWFIYVLLYAVERKQYGWFWVCPNGDKNCHYRHALPPGYVLKSQMKALLEEERDKITNEEEIENQRAKVATTTSMTPELFHQWKKKKVEERDASLAAQQADRAKNDRMSGRELFLSDATLFVDDDEAYERYQREPESENTEQKENGNSAEHGPSASATAGFDADDVDNDDDELDLDELNELEASLSKTSIQIKEPGAEA
ncbi:putative transcription factor C3H family [Lupinus albus]|uniref:Putative transcription factor C3H family n=1 Tax=Lupinus albus TaxID=3870 RepID=A0A6A4QEN9_LUPAL|nr:putative transcription factor C3H family [Lupinus albus]